ncbi:MAG: hypothetical protein WDM85_13965 [Caulobacteraceae bacterium]
MLFGGVTALIYVVIAFLPPVYGVLLAGMVIATAAFQIVAAAAGGLLSTIGQQQAMAGRMSVLLGVAAAAPALASNFAEARSANTWKAKARWRRPGRCSWSRRDSCSALRCWA